MHKILYFFTFSIFKQCFGHRWMFCTISNENLQCFKNIHTETNNAWTMSWAVVFCTYLVTKISTMLIVFFPFVQRKQLSIITQKSLTSQITTLFCLQTKSTQLTTSVSTCFYSSRPNWPLHTNPQNKQSFLHFRPSLRQPKPETRNR